MNKKELKNLIIKYWHNQISSDELDLLNNYLHENPAEFNDILKNDPAYVFPFISNEINHRLDQVDDIIIPLSMTQSTQIKHYKKIQSRQTKAKGFIVSFSLRKLYKIALPVAGLLLLLLYTLPLLIKRDQTYRPYSYSDKAQKHSQKFEKKINYNDTNLKIPNTVKKKLKGKLYIQGQKNVYNNSNFMVSNLVADGDKVVQYKLDNETEIIFITGLH